MTANEGQIGNGCQLLVGATTIGNITSLGLPDMSVDDVDITSMGETDTTQYRSFVAGLIDPGEISVEVNFERANYEKCLNKLGEDQDTITLKLGPASATLSFGGYVKSLGGAAPQGDVITAPISIKVSGPISYTSAA